MSVSQFWVNGELVPTAAAKVSVLDHGFTVADGVFETLLVNEGQIFALDRHLARLTKSAIGLGLAAPDLALITEGISHVLSANQKVEFGRVRITVTSGVGPLGSDRISSDPTMVISLAEQPEWPESTAILLVPWTRNENSPLAGLKTTSYAENVYALAAAKRHGFSEAVFCDTSGRLCEGTGSNIFLIKNEQIITPSDSSGLLRGVTRDLVIELACESGFDVVERDVDPMELWSADETFITSSTRDVHPVMELANLDATDAVVDRRSLDIGLITQQLGKMFLTHRTENLNP
jgi:branched-chain amino acid aminotransferase